MRICLTMIVKDEESVIGRCLDALKPFIDCWLIVDTGSSDKTRELIREHMEGVPGELHESPFKSFRHNRTEAMALARKAFPDSDYLLMMDADDLWEAPEGWTWPEDLDRDAYSFQIRMGNTSWWRPDLTKTSTLWRYEGVAHEYLVCDTRNTQGKIQGASKLCVNDGHRRTAEPVEKYERVARLLEKDLEENPGNPRSTFYLAQSYKDCGRKEDAIRVYRERAMMGGWSEEVFYSWFQIGVLSNSLGRWPDAEAAFLKAYEARPQRAEPLVNLAAHYRQKQNWAMAVLYATTAADTPRPEDLLFVDDSVYTWRAMDEYAVSSWWAGRKEKARVANLELLRTPNLPLNVRARITKNLAFCPGAPAPETLAEPGTMVTLDEALKMYEEEVRNAG